MKFILKFLFIFLSIIFSNSKAFETPIDKYMQTTAGVVIIAGIGMANSNTLMQAADVQMKESDENIKKIETLMKSFQDSYKNDCIKGRDNLSDLKCYCYQENGNQNPSRTNSGSCQALWAKSDYLISASASSYKSTTGSVTAVGCVTIAGQYDEACNCKKINDQKGNNVCMKSVSLNLGSNGLGVGYVNSSGLSSVFQNLTSLTSGNGMASSISSNSLAIALNKQKEINKAIFDKIKNDPTKKGFGLIGDEKKLQALSNSIFSKNTLDQFNKTGGGSAMLALSDSRPSGLMGEAIKEVQKKTGEIETVGMGKGLGVNKKTEENKNGFNFSFSEPTAQNGQVNGQGSVDFMNKNYQYKNSDVSKDNGNSIFEIISNRYVESGLKRLFEE
jgi:hypothetical protein